MPFYKPHLNFLSRVLGGLRTDGYVYRLEKFLSRVLGGLRQKPFRN